MAKKPSKAKKASAPKRKSAKKRVAKQPRRRDDGVSSSVLGGPMQDVIRSSFLKR